MMKAPVVLLPIALLAGCKAGTMTDAATESTLLPLATGRMWQYQITTVGNAGCATTDNVMMVGIKSSTGGKTSYQVAMPCTNGQSSTFAFDGSGLTSKVLIYQNNHWDTYIDQPLQEDKSWSYLNGSIFTWQSIDEAFSTRAGDFPDCYKRLAQDGVSFIWFCQSVGIAGFHQDNGSGVSYDGILTYKNF